MKKIKTLFMGALLLVTGNAMADKFTASEITIEPGQQGEILVGIENAATIYAFQFDLTLPSGISLVKDEDEEAYGVFVKGRTAKNGTFTFKKVDTAWQIVYFNAALDEETGEPVPIKKNSGDVVKLFIKAAANYGGGEAIISGAKTTDQTTIPVAAEGVTFKINSSVPNGIKNINAAENNAPVYTMGGQRVTNPKKGLYVKDGHKVVVK